MFALSLARSCEKVLVLVIHNDRICLLVVRLVASDSRDMIPKDQDEPELPRLDVAEPGLGELERIAGDDHVRALSVGRPVVGLGTDRDLARHCRLLISQGWDCRS